MSLSYDQLMKQREALAETIRALRDVITHDGETKDEFIARVREILGADPDKRVATLGLYRRALTKAVSLPMGQLPHGPAITPGCATAIAWSRSRGRNPPPRNAERTEMSAEQPICEAFAVIAELCCAMGAAPLMDHEGCWELQVDERWWIAVNGHGIDKACSKGTTVAPFNCYVEYNGWPAGLFNPYGGSIAAGECANEETFLAALRARMPNSEGPK